MAEQKTKQNDASVEAFLDTVADTQKREDARTVLKLMQDITGEPPKMWGGSIIGFGTYHYKYASGHKGDCCLTGFSPRKDKLSLYFMTGFEPFADLMKKLGKYKTGKACLYIKRLADVDLAVLAALVRAAFQRQRSAPNARAAAPQSPVEEKKKPAKAQSSKPAKSKTRR